MTGTTLPARRRRMPGESLERLADIAARQGLTLLTQQWYTLRYGYLFRCMRGHTFTRIGMVAMRGTERAAVAHDGRLLGETHAGIGEDYLWECTEGHRWRARGEKVVEGGWCAVCASRRHGEQQRDPEGLERLKEAAGLRGGECLAQSYSGQERKYRFRCVKGHEWEAYGHLVLRGSRRMQCSNQAKRRTIEQMQEVARERGGRCLSDTYVNNRTRLLWECSQGHVWSAAPDNVINRGAWCPDCFRLRITKRPHLRRRYGHEG